MMILSQKSLYPQKGLQRILCPGDCHFLCRLKFHRVSGYSAVLLLFWIEEAGVTTLRAHRQHLHHPFHQHHVPLKFSGFLFLPGIRRCKSLGPGVSYGICRLRVFAASGQFQSHRDHRMLFGALWSLWGHAASQLRWLPRFSFRFTFFMDAVLPGFPVVTSCPAMAIFRAGDIGCASSGSPGRFTAAYTQDLYESEQGKRTLVLGAAVFFFGCGGLLRGNYFYDVCPILAEFRDDLTTSNILAAAMGLSPRSWSRRSQIKGALSIFLDSFSPRSDRHHLGLPRFTFAAWNAQWR